MQTKKCVLPGGWMSALLHQRYKGFDRLSLTPGLLVTQSVLEVWTCCKVSITCLTKRLRQA